MVEQQRAHVTLGRVHFGLALRYSEEEGQDQDKRKCLSRAEKEFLIAKDLTRHPK